jgi:hypothetical protein
MKDAFGENQGYYKMSFRQNDIKSICRHSRPRFRKDKLQRETGKHNGFRVALACPE